MLWAGGEFCWLAVGASSSSCVIIGTGTLEDAGVAIVTLGDCTVSFGWLVLNDMGSTLGAGSWLA